MMWRIVNQNLLRPAITKARTMNPSEVSATTMWPCRSRYDSLRILKFARTISRGVLGESERSVSLPPRIFEATEMSIGREFRRAQQVTYKTRCDFQPIESLGRAWMSNKRDWIFMERPLGETTKSMGVHPRLGTTMGFSRSRSDAPLGCRNLHTSCPAFTPTVFREEAEVGERLVKFETGFITYLSRRTKGALLPSRSKGAVVLRDGDSYILGTMCSRRKARQRFKLIGEYREDPSARRRLLDWRGRCYVTPWASLTGDLNSRCFSPLIVPQPMTIHVCSTAYTVMWDSLSDIPALNAASAAMSVSNLAWRGPFGAVRIGMLHSGILIVDPSQGEICDCFLTYVATRSEEVIVEFESKYYLEVPLEKKMRCIELAKSQVIKLIDAQDRLRLRCLGK